VPMTDEREHDVSGLIRAITERTKVVFLCTPNNPTGNSMPEADVRRILRLGLPTVIDEAYYELGSGSSVAHLVEEYPNAILLRTFSKALGLAGLRLGYALAHPVVIRLLGRVKVPWNLPAITLAAASAALDDLAEIESRVRELRVARADLTRRLARIPGLVPSPSEGNFILVDISGTELEADALVDAVLGEGVLIRSLAVHHATKRYVRVTVGTREQNARCASAFRRALGRLRRPAAAEKVAAPMPAFAGMGDAE